MEIIAFKGWIPAVSGRLSFTAFGDTHHPNEARSVNVADSKIRFLVAYQERTTSDGLVPRLFNLDGAFCYLFLAKTADGDSFKQQFLIGRTFIFSLKSGWKSVLPHIADLQAHLASFQDHAHPSLEDHMVELFDNANFMSKRYCLFYSDISIGRNGTTDVKVEWPQQVAANAPLCPSSGRLKEKFVHQLAAQTFFFLKDLGHRHQHHNPYTDTIVDLHSADVRDVDWRLSTLYSIYRKIIHYKRHPDKETFNDCMGLVAYAESFHEICTEDLPPTRREFMPKYYSKNMIESIKSTQAKLERKATNSQRRLDIVRNTIISITSLFVGFIGLIRLSNYQPKEPPSQAYLFLLHNFLHRPIPSLTVIAFLGLSIVVLFSDDYGLVTKTKIVLLRILQVFRKVYSVIIISLLGLSLLALAALILYPEIIE